MARDEPPFVNVISLANLEIVPKLLGRNIGISMYIIQKLARSSERPIHQFHSSRRFKLLQVNVVARAMKSFYLPVRSL